MRVRDLSKQRAAAPAERTSRDPAHRPGSAASAPRRRFAFVRPMLAGAPRYLAPVALTWVLTLPLFAPWSVWPLAFIAFTPWLALVCRAPVAAGMYVASYLLGAGFFFTHWRWLLITTPPGYVVGCVVFALYFCLAAWIVRHLYQRRRISVTFAFPVAWILVEMMRSRGPLAFPWFLLGHSQIRFLSFVQIADVLGVYGVSFAVAMVNGLLVDLYLRRKTSPTACQPAQRAWPATPIIVVCVLGGFLGYGWWRLASLPLEIGPRAAVLQGDYLLSAEENVTYTQWMRREKERQSAYLQLLFAAAKQQPDLYILPETPWSMYLNRELLDVSPEILQRLNRAQRAAWEDDLRTRNEWTQRFSAFAREHQAGLVVGAMSQERQPPGAYPANHRYNSAFVFGPDGAEAQRYDKIHLVMFGEFVPFRYSIPAVYWWINGLTPWGQGGYEYSLTPGAAFRVFSLPPRTAADSQAVNRPQPGAAGDARFGITICYEDVIPQVFRRFTLDDQGRKRVDFMLNISNDGWFGHGAQQAQHLVNCAFRAIENRVGIARSVNTGVSGFVRPDGTWHDLVASDPRWPTAGGVGQQVAQLTTSPAVTLYARFGDLFGAAVALVACIAVLDALVCRIAEKRVRTSGHVNA